MEIIHYIESGDKKQIIINYCRIRKKLIKISKKTTVIKKFKKKSLSHNPINVSEYDIFYPEQQREQRNLKKKPIFLHILKIIFLFISLKTTHFLNVIAFKTRISFVKYVFFLTLKIPGNRSIIFRDNQLCNHQNVTS